MQDKETLYDNTVQLKRYANVLVEENQRLKARVQQLDEDISRRNKMMSGLMAQMGNMSSGTQGVQKMQKEVAYCNTYIDPSNRSAEATRTTDRSHVIREGQ